MIGLNLPTYYNVPNTTDPGGSTTGPVFRATSTCPNVSLWIAFAVIVGIVIGRVSK